MEVRHYHWKDGKSLTVGERTLVMGVLNYTPDSFSDGGKWNNADVALKHMEETADYAMRTGAHIMNDIWGLQYAPEPGQMAAVAAKYGVPVVVMHNQDGTEYGDIIEDMKRFFIRSAIIADQAGMSQDQIIADPGIGFGKTFDQNVYVMKHLRDLTGLPYPMLLGTSRKGFIGKILDLPVTERMEGTGTTCVAGVLAGCAIVRVHDVKPIVRMCQMADALR